jgi:hypothetical protein
MSPSVPLLPGWVNYWQRVYAAQQSLGMDARRSAEHANVMLAKATLIELRLMRTKQGVVK